MHDLNLRHLAPRSLARDNEGVPTLYVLGPETENYAVTWLTEKGSAIH